jgi:DNA-binding PadR family transcriptional regulator
MKARDVILGTLMKGPMSGYDIKQRFESIFAYFFDASYGAIYPTLHQMEKDGLITKEVVVQEGRPNKNVFSITERGKEMFQNYLASELEPDVYRSDFMMRLFFGVYVDERKIQQWLEEKISQTQKSIERLEQDYRNWKPKMTTTQEVCIQIGISHQKAQLEVLERAIRQIRDLKTGEKTYEGL